MFGMSDVRDSNAIGCVFHSPYQLPFCFFLHVGIVFRLAVPGEHGHRKPWPVAQKGNGVLPLLVKLDKSWRRTPVGSSWVTGPSMPQSLWSGSVGYSDWPRMGWGPTPITSGFGDIAPLVSGVRICEI